MERMEKQEDYSAEDKLNDLRDVFGESGTTRLMSQIAHDNPTLTNKDVVDHAWSLIPEATAYALPARQEDLTESAIDIHEGYEAHRRIED